MKGNKLTRRHLVLLELLRARRGKVYWYNKHITIPRGWVPAWVIVSPKVGGIGGLRRLRELRARGLEIEVRTFCYKDQHDNLVRTDTTIYRLKTSEEYIDFENARCLSHFRRIING